jgi:hypothetical protein
MPCSCYNDHCEPVMCASCTRHTDSHSPTSKFITKVPRSDIKFAESKYMKARRRREIRRARAQKYSDPLPEDISFANEDFNNEISGMQSFPLEVVHSYNVGKMVKSISLLRGTVYILGEKTIIVAHYAFYDRARRIHRCTLSTFYWKVIDPMIDEFSAPGEYETIMPTYRSHGLKRKIYERYPFNFGR